MTQQKTDKQKANPFSVDKRTNTFFSHPVLSRVIDNLDGQITDTIADLVDAVRKHNSVEVENEGVKKMTVLKREEWEMPDLDDLPENVQEMIASGDTVMKEKREAEFLAFYIKALKKKHEAGDLAMPDAKFEKACRKDFEVSQNNKVTARSVGALKQSRDELRLAAKVEEYRKAHGGKAPSAKTMDALKHEISNAQTAVRSDFECKLSEYKKAIKQNSKIGISECGRNALLAVMHTVALDFVTTYLTVGFEAMEKNKVVINLDTLTSQEFMPKTPFKNFYKSAELFRHCLRKVGDKVMAPECLSFDKVKTFKSRANHIENFVIQNLDLQDQEEPVKVTVKYARQAMDLILIELIQKVFASVIQNHRITQDARQHNEKVEEAHIAALKGLQAKQKQLRHAKFTIKGVHVTAAIVNILTACNYVDGEHGVVSTIREAIRLVQESADMYKAGVAASKDRVDKETGVKTKGVPYVPSYEVLNVTIDHEECICDPVTYYSRGEDIPKKQRVRRVKPEGEKPEKKEKVPKKESAKKESAKKVSAKKS